MRSTMTDEQRSEIARLLGLGINCCEIARRLGLSQSQVFRQKKALKEKEELQIVKGNLIHDEYDLDKYKWLLKNWHFKKPEPPKPKPRKVNFRTPYNYDSIRRKEESDDH